MRLRPPGGPETGDRLFSSQGERAGADGRAGGHFSGALFPGAGPEQLLQRGFSLQRQGGKVYAGLTRLTAVLLLLLGMGLGGRGWAQETLEVLGLRFRLIPGGTYVLGSAPDQPVRYSAELPEYRVVLKPFYISVTEITNEQYGRFLTATGRRPPLYWHDPALNGPRQPVVGVSWYEAVAYTEWLTRTTGVVHRLPTEAEWEAAARGGLIGQPYPWGAEPPDAGGRFRANYYPNDFAADGFRFTAPVGSFPPNGYGLYDMAGNVAEWCLDRFTPTRPTSFAHPEARVLRGGSWMSRARELRVASRQYAPPEKADGFIGFRVVRLIKASGEKRSSSP